MTMERLLCFYGTRPWGEIITLLFIDETFNEI